MSLIKKFPDPLLTLLTLLISGLLRGWSRAVQFAHYRVWAVLASIAILKDTVAIGAILKIGSSILKIVPVLQIRYFKLVHTPIRSTPRTPHGADLNDPPKPQ